MQPERPRASNSVEVVRSVLGFFIANLALAVVRVVVILVVKDLVMDLVMDLVCVVV